MSAIDGIDRMPDFNQNLIYKESALRYLISHVLTKLNLYAMVCMAVLGG
jgi:hypothetical protein